MAPVAAADGGVYPPWCSPQRTLWLMVVEALAWCSQARVLLGLGASSLGLLSPASSSLVSYHCRTGERGWTLSASDVGHC